MSHAYEVSRATVMRGRRCVLDEVSLTVPQGRLLALVGPNGAGKSTLLGALAGDIALDGGEVWLHGRLLRSWRTHELARTRAMLLQENHVAFSFTAGEVVRMGRSPWKAESTPDEDDAACDRAIALTDVAHLIEQPYSTLSGGERARVSLARVLAQDTPVVLLDEPTAALDLRHQEEVMRLARDLADEGRAVVVVLHDLTLAAAYADEIAVLADGRIVAHGAPADVITPEIVETTYGTPVHVVPDAQGRPVVLPDRTQHHHPTSPRRTTMTITAEPTSPAAPLSTMMREGSAAEHKEAEGSTFMSELLEGRINEAGYTDYLARLRRLYEGLERVGRRLAGHPLAGVVVDPDLERLAALDADLAFWGAGRTPDASSPAIDRYLSAVEATLENPVLFVAHHYTRYLGDLSGGQAIGRILQRDFGLADGQGVAFYRFDAVPKPKLYKDAYRARLDALPLDDATKNRVVVEVKSAFHLNGAVFAELTANLDRYRRQPVG